ncbi:hypothetical protein ABFX02_12G110500 [Erythranthe guttata]
MMGNNKMRASCVLISIFVSFVASGIRVCEGGVVDCTIAPILDLAPCAPYISGSASKPTRECCSGARSWENFEPGSLLCRCMKTWPGRLPYPLIPKTIARLKIECGLTDRFSDVFCCIFDDSCP